MLGINRGSPGTVEWDLNPTNVIEGVEGQSLNLDLFLKCTSMRYARHRDGARDGCLELHNRQTFLEFICKL